MVKRIMILPDVHVSPVTEEEDKQRLFLAGQYFVANKHDTCVCLGDFADMPSLCTYDKGTTGFEGRRYKKDINSTSRVMGSFFAPIYAERERLIKQKRKRWNPEFLMCMGNHEERINRAVYAEPILEDTISVQDLEYEEWGWDVKPFGVPHIYCNICFSHSFPSGVMNRPISGEHHASSLLKKNYMSSVCGHSHLLDFDTDVASDGTRKFGLVAGCFTEDNPKYAGASSRLWWRGLTSMEVDEETGEFLSIYHISLDRLRG